MQTRIATAMAMVVALLPAAAHAQWEIEIHTGGAFGNQPASGSAALPDAGAPFTAINGRPSRRESSWFVGDGAALINQLNAARGASARVSALDPVLTTAVAKREMGAGFGVRVSRDVGSRYAVELSLDYRRASLKLSDTALAAVEASRASFVSAFGVPLPAGAQGLAPVMTATATVASDQPRGYQTLTTGALIVKLRTSGKLTPYAVAGGGVAIDSDDAPTVNLTGNYRIAGPPGSKMAGVVVHSETDAVTLHYAVDRRVFAGVLGAGVKYAASSRWGVRADVRAILTRNGVSNQVDLRPSVEMLTPATVLALPVNPTVQFSSNLSTGSASSLSGPAVSDFQTFSGSGLRMRVDIVTGVFWRF